MRLPEATAEWLKTTAGRAGRSVSDLSASLVEEARRVAEFAEIEFRTFGGDGQVCLAGGLRLWKVIVVAQDYAMDVDQSSAHFDPQLRFRRPRPGAARALIPLFRRILTRSSRIPGTELKDYTITGCFQDPATSGYFGPLHVNSMHPNCSP